MDINERCRLLPDLRTEKTEWGGGKNEDSVITLGYPKYSEQVRAWIDAFHSLELSDKNYIENLEGIKNKQINELTRDETLTRLTAIIRAERFCEGSIADALKSGLLEELCEHLKATVKDK